MAQPVPKNDSERIPEKVRPAAVGAAGLLVIFTGVAATYLEFRSRSAHMAMSNLPLAVLLPFVYWLLINAVLKRFAPRWSLRARELRMVFSCLWVGGAFAGYNWATQWVGTMAAPQYFASPENRWREVIFDYLPWWMYPRDFSGIVERFYTGLNPGEATPWGAWFGPIFWAFSSALAMTAIGVGLTAIFQKQWVEHERLTYPLAQIPIDLTGGFDGKRGWPRFMQNRMFWVGFGIAAFPLLFNIIAFFYPGFPRIAIFDAYYGPSGPRGASVSRYLGPLSYRMLPTVMGFTFLCDLDILFSIWFLYLVGLGVRYGMNRVGFTVGLSGQVAKTGEILGLFSHGVMIGLVIWAVWASRGHLKRIWRQILRPLPDGQCDTVILSPRGALLAVLGGGVYMVFWLKAAGYDLAFAVSWLVLFWIGIFAVMKYLSASGFAYLFPDWGGGILTIWAGTRHMSDTTLVAMRVVNWRLLAGWRLPAALPHIERLFGRKRSSASLIFISAAAGLLVAALYTMWMCYGTGGANFRTWSLVGAPQGMYDGIASAITDLAGRTVPDPGKITVWLFGIGLALAATVLQSRVPWWPIHPLGLMLMYDGYVELYALCIFVVWLGKLLVLKLGGIGQYRRVKPLSYGLIVGYVFAAGCSFLVDFIWFPQGGHYIHGY